MSNRVSITSKIKFSQTIKFNILLSAALDEIIYELMISTRRFIFFCWSVYLRKCPARLFFINIEYSILVVIVTYTYSLFCRTIFLLVRMELNIIPIKIISLFENNCSLLLRLSFFPFPYTRDRLITWPFFNSNQLLDRW